MRKFVVAGEVFECRFGRGALVIRDQARKTFYVNYHTINGTTPDVFDRGQYKRTSDGMVLPSQICEYIRKNVIGGR